MIFWMDRSASIIRNSLNVGRICALLIILQLVVGLSGAKSQVTTAPRSFEAIARSTTEIDVYLLPNSVPTGCRIFRDNNVIATVDSGVTSYRDTGLTPNTTYQYSIEPTVVNGSQDFRTYRERTFPQFPTGASKWDVVVVQASSGGVAAAYEAGRRGLRVALVEPTGRLGGMPVNGLSATDMRRPQHAAGFFVRFKDRVKDLYAAEGITTNGFEYEPRVAHQAMKSLLYDVPNVTVFRYARLGRVIAGDPNSETGRRLVQAVDIAELGLDGKPTGRSARLEAPVYIDATDCGDLAAGAGARFRLGREPRSAKEPHNGMIYYDRADDKILPGSTGAGDNKIQAYTYLLTVKDYGAGTDHTIQKPAGYRREDFIHSPGWKESWAYTSGKMPGSKYELNQHPQGGDIQGINYRYPLDGYAERARMDALYREHVLCYLYYIQTELGQKQIGLPDDEYRESGGFPPLLYVREGRRILGEQTPTEADITHGDAIDRPESIGIGDYPMDSHAVEPKVNWNTPDMGEGEWWLYKYTPVHELPLGIIVPKDLDNVLVTTAVSSTHVSFGTYRLEPVRMEFGEAAAAIAFISLTHNLSTYQIPQRQVQEALLPHLANRYGDDGTVVRYWSDLPTTEPYYHEMQYLASRGFYPSGELYKPDAPTTRQELFRWLSLMTRRANPWHDSLPAELYDRAHLTETLDAATAARGYDAGQLNKMQAWAASDQPITRIEYAYWFCRIFPELRANRLARPSDSRFADIQDSAQIDDATTLFDHYMDPTSLDGGISTTEVHQGFFRPSSEMSHGLTIASLYIALKEFGPLYYDNPADIRNGFAAESEE